MSKQRNEDIRKMTFGKFENEEDTYEKKYQFEAGQSDYKKQKGKKQILPVKPKRKRARSNP